MKSSYSNSRTRVVLICLLLFGFIDNGGASTESGEQESKHPEAHEVPKHTTGPNCWIDKQPTADLLAYIPGTAAFPSNFSTEDILHHVGRPHFVNITESYYSCVDGRYRAGIVATAGGDAAEFLLALNIAQRNGLTMNQFVVTGLFNDYLEFVGPFRQFYMHTDMHAWENVTGTLGLHGVTEDYVLDPPDEMKERLLNMLCKPQGIGCGHLKAIVNDPVTSMTPGNLTTWFMTAFFQYMWNQDAVRLAEDKKLKYVVLEGNHKETAVIEIYKTGCPGLAPAVASDTEENSFFVHHAAATKVLRESLAEFMIRKYPISLNLTVENFLDQSEAIGGIQLQNTLAKLAKGLPFYSVHIQGEQIQNWHAVIGLMLFCSLAWILGGIFSIIVWRYPKGSIELETINRIIGEGSTTTVAAVSIIIYPLFGFIGLVMWLTMSWTLMIDFILAAVFFSISCLAILRISSSCNIRTVHAIADKSMFEGFLVAYQTSLVASLVGCSPLLIMITVMRLFWEAAEGVITFGFGASIVLLLLRIGGSIFAAATQTSYQKMRVENDAENRLNDTDSPDLTFSPQFSSPKSASPNVPRNISGLSPTVPRNNSLVVPGINRATSSRSFDSVGSNSSRISSTTSQDGSPLPRREYPREVNYDSVAILQCVGDVVDNAMGLTLEVSDSILLSLVSALAIGTSMYSVDGMALPFWLLAVGMTSSVTSSILVLISLCIFCRNSNTTTIFRWMRAGWVLSSITYLALAAAVNFLLHFNTQLYGCIVIGHCSRIVMIVMAEITTSKNIKGEGDLDSSDRAQIHTIKEEETHLLGLLLKALLIGMSSSLTPVFIVFIVLLSTGYLAGQFGISIAVLSMMATENTSMCYNAVSSVFSASRRVAEMTCQGPSVIDKCISLESLGHRCASVVKFFSTGSSALVSFSLFVAVAYRAGPDSVDLMKDPQVLPGLVLGAMVPFLFSSLTMMTLSQVAKSITARASFEDAAAASTTRKSHKKVAAWAVYTSMVNLLIPTTFAIAIPVSIYVIFGEEVLIGFIGGALLSGSVMSSTLVNTGAYFAETENFLSTSLMEAGGPSINVLTKFCCMVALMSTMDGAWRFFVVLMSVCFLGMVVSYAIRKLRKKYGWNYKTSMTFMKLVDAEEWNQEEKPPEEEPKVERDDHFVELTL
ncbi:hypothetical protein PROFUN_05636 [Planoprotostelium fungivorum]|uniref:H(+)-exporting diphosphatase n=1 Tax=Planoprotostelium fungivorum TaxID=1890364 RepID=A0A2P6MUD2_9EUKA|nr:hypothetical protein PROFUN_05636 [Planoprotostelium fungivorum]